MEAAAPFMAFPENTERLQGERERKKLKIKLSIPLIIAHIIRAILHILTYFFQNWLFSSWHTSNKLSKTVLGCISADIIAQKY